MCHIGSEKQSTTKKNWIANTAGFSSVCFANRYHPRLQHLGRLIVFTSDNKLHGTISKLDVFQTRL